MAEQQPAQELKDLSEKFEQGLKDICMGGYMENYLNTMSRFPSYSARNTMLIHLQNPNATCLMGYHSWKNSHSRQVSRGEKGIRIISPSPTKTLKMKDQDKDGYLYLDPQGNPKARQIEVTRPALKAVSVFDIAQTTGPDVSQYAWRYSEDHPDTDNFITALHRIDSYSMLSDVPEDGSDLDKIRALISNSAFDLVRPKYLGRTAEVMEDCISFVVLKHYEVEPPKIDFKTITKWAKKQPLETLKHTLDSIQASAAILIGDINYAYESCVGMTKEEQIKFNLIPDIVIEPLSPELFAAEIIKEYESEEQRLSKCIIGEQEKNLIRDFASNNNDLNEIYLFVDRIVKEQSEVNTGVVNPEIQALVNAAIWKTQDKNLDTPFIPIFENLNETTDQGGAVYTVCDGSDGTTFLVDETDTDIFPIKVIQTETRESAVVGFSYDRAFMFDAQAYSSTLLSSDISITRMDQMQFDGQPGLWNIAMKSEIAGYPYYLAYNKTGKIIVDRDGTVLTEKVLREDTIIEPTDLREAVERIRYENQSARAQQDGIVLTVKAAALETQVTSGQPISLMDLAAAAKAEQHKDAVKQLPRNSPLSERVKRAREQAQKQQKQTKPSREQPKRNQMER